MAVGKAIRRRRRPCAWATPRSALALSAAPFATNVEPAALKSWLDDSLLPLETFPWANNALVVRSGGQTILIDSGVGAAYPDFPQAGRLAMRLEAAGIDPGSVTDAVITHMHMDHVGGLLVDGLRSRLRADLRVYVAATEVEFWESPDFSQTDMPQAIPDVLRETARRFVDAYRSELRLFEREHMVAPGCSYVTPAATPPGTAWSGWRPAATG